MAPRISEDFFNCGHTRTPDNMRCSGKRKGVIYYCCRQCTNRQRRKSYKPHPIKNGPNFPCGHPRLEANIYWHKPVKRKGRINNVFKKQKLTALCRTCRLLKWEKDKHKINAQRRKRGPQYQMGSIVVGRCYESDKQCTVCGYMLRYTKSSRTVTLDNGKVLSFNDECVACSRAKSKTRWKRNSLKLVMAEKQHTRASDIHRCGKSELTNTTDLRQDASP